MFEAELDFFKSNQDSLVEKYKGKVLVLRNKEVVGVYSTTLEAYSEAKKSFALGTFMIQPCAPGPEAYTVTISTLGLLA